MEKKVRTPRNYDSIRSGALLMPLAEKVTLCKQLQSSIQEEINNLTKQSDEAQKLAASLNSK